MNYQADIAYISSQNLQLYYYGHEECLPGHSCGPAIRDHYLLKYVKRGKGVYKINNREYSISEKCCFFLFPGELAFYQADYEEPWEYFWIGFHGMMAKDYLEGADIIPSNPVLNSINVTKIENLFENLLVYKAARDNIDELFTTGILNLILCEILREAGYREDTAQKSGFSLKTDYIQKAIKFMHMNYSNSISISSVANYISLDRTYFSKLFKYTTGQSPADFLAEIRITKAKNLLTHSSLSIEAIALSTGFSSIFYFSSAFKKITGITPSDYRKHRDKKESAHS